MKTKVVRKCVTIKSEKLIGYLDDVYKNEGVSYTDLINIALEEKYKRDKSRGSGVAKVSPETENHYPVFRLHRFFKRTEHDGQYSTLLANSEQKTSYYDVFIPLEDINGFYQGEVVYRFLLKLKYAKKLHDLVKNKIENEIIASGILYDRADLTLAIVSDLNINILELIEKDKKYSLKLNLNINWDRFLINIENKNSRYLNFLDIQYYRYKEYFKMFKLDDSHVHACLSTAKYGGYFIRILKASVDKEIILKQIHNKYKNKISFNLSSDIITVSSSGLKSKKIITNKIEESSQYDLLENILKMNRSKSK